MPLFFDPLLVFLHIPKNAGRSIEDVFLPAHDNQDWGRPNRLNSAARYLLDRTRSDMAWRHRIGTQDITVAAQHLTYVEMEMLGLLPEQEPRAIFCVCRNPFDRAVSSVTHFKGAPGDPREFERSLAEWLEEPLSDHNRRAHRRTQRAFVLDSKGADAATHVLRFESLQADFDGMLADLGLSAKELPWRGKAGRGRDLSALYTPEAKRLVERAYGEDLEHFGYGFD